MEINGVVVTCDNSDEVIYLIKNLSSKTESNNDVAVSELKKIKRSTRFTAERWSDDDTLIVAENYKKPIKTIKRLLSTKRTGNSIRCKISKLRIAEIIKA